MIQAGTWLAGEQLCGEGLGDVGRHVRWTWVSQQHALAAKAANGVLWSVNKSIVSWYREVIRPLCSKLGPRLDTVSTRKTLTLFSYTKFPLARSSCLSRSHWVAALPVTVLSSFPCSMSSVNFTTVHSHCLFQVIDEVVEQDWSQYRPLQTLGDFRVEFNPLNRSHWAWPLNWLFIHLVVQDGVKKLAKVKVNDIHCSPPVHKSCQLIIEGCQVDQPSVNSSWLLPITFFMYPEMCSKRIHLMNFPGIGVRL